MSLSESLSFTQLPSDINAAQWKAITFKGKHLLIVAGPGTGKTHTLTYRIVRIVEQLKKSQKILAVTFTNKAADEMRFRLRERLDDEIEKVHIGTFHSFCVSILRKNIKETGLPKDFKVAAPDEIEGLAKKIWKDKDKSGRKALLDKISSWKSIDFDEEKGEEAVQYDEYLRYNGFLDFDDILLETIKLFKNNEKVIKKVGKEYPYIFVDEYQDINPAQHALLKLMVTDEVNITAIGDPNQAIYGFRGSDVEFFENFPDDFEDTTKLHLEDNFRSAPNLLDASGQVIEKGDTAHVPNLTAQIIQQGRLIVHDSATDKSEAEYVVHQVEKMVGGTSMFSQDSERVNSDDRADRSFGDIAVLYRLNSQRDKLKAAFERSGIPFKISGERPLETRLLPETDESYEDRTERVSLMTLHASKGLEFPVVFIIGCEKALLPLNIAGFSSSESEERRLFYVGMTRAKERLYLTWCQKRFLYGKVFTNEPSPFLYDIEEELKAYEKAIERKKKKKDSQQLTLFE